MEEPRQLKISKEEKSPVPSIDKPMQSVNFDVKKDENKNINLDKAKNIAASLQSYLETIVIKIIKNLDLEYDFKNLCLSGGVIFNSVLNGKISEIFSNKKIFLHHNAGDAGGFLIIFMIILLIILKGYKIKN